MEIIQNLTEHNNQKLLGQLMQLSMRKLVQELLEKEVGEYSYECIRILAGPIMSMERQEGVIRNGYKPAHLKTAEDRFVLQKPQVADSPETFSSQLWSHIKGRTE